MTKICMLLNRLTERHGAVSQFLVSLGATRVVFKSRTATSFNEIYSKQMVMPWSCQPFTPKLAFEKFVEQHKKGEQNDC